MWLYVDGQEVRFGTARGYSPSVFLSAQVAPSDSAKPVECYVQGTTVWARATGSITPRMPSDLRQATGFPDEWDYRGLGDYNKIRTFQVWDNYGWEWNYPNMPVWEQYSIQSNGCNMQIITGENVTNWYGRFVDNYGTPVGAPPMPACRVKPGCVTNSRQTISVTGYEFSHDVTWRCESVDIGRN